MSSKIINHFNLIRINEICINLHGTLLHYYNNIIYIHFYAYKYFKEYKITGKKSLIYTMLVLIIFYLIFINIIYILIKNNHI